MLIEIKETLFLDPKKILFIWQEPNHNDKLNIMYDTGYECSTFIFPLEPTGRQLIAAVKYNLTTP